MKSIAFPLTSALALAVAATAQAQTQDQPPHDHAHDHDHGDGAHSHADHDHGAHGHSHGEPAAAPQASLGIGSEAPELTGLDYLQGEPVAPTLDEEGKVYLLDAWATWCGPCIQAMPHLRELSETYGEQGLQVLGINVMEDDRATVAEFVESNEDMTFPVAFSGGWEGAFTSDWLEPAGVVGIPAVFLVQDGTIIATSVAKQIDGQVIMPQEITEQMIEDALSGDFDVEANRRASEEREAALVSLNEHLGPLLAAEDWQGVLELEDEIRAAGDPGMTAQLLSTAYLNTGDWDGLESLLAELPLQSATSVDQTDVHAMIAGSAPTGDELRDFAGRHLESFQSALESSAVEGAEAIGPYTALLRYQVLGGVEDTSATLATIESAFDAAVAEGMVPEEVAQTWVEAFTAEADNADFRPLEQVVTP